jgi:Bacterial Ig domain
MKCADKFVETGVPVQMVENALLAAASQHSAVGDYPAVRECFDKLAGLELPERAKKRFSTIAQRYRGLAAPPVEFSSLPDYLKQQHASRARATDQWQGPGGGRHQRGDRDDGRRRDPRSDVRSEDLRGPGVRLRRGYRYVRRGPQLRHLRRRSDLYSAAPVLRAHHVRDARCCLRCHLRWLRPILTCGSCAAGQTCTAQNQCCTPTSCAAQGVTCGSRLDGCGGILTCGSCAAGSTCQSGACVPLPDSAPPTVSITAPTAGAVVSGTVTLIAAAFDDVAVTQVELYDGTILLRICG